MHDNYKSSFNHFKQQLVTVLGFVFQTFLSLNKKTIQKNYDRLAHMLNED